MDLNKEQVASLTYKPQTVLLAVFSSVGVVICGFGWLAYLYLDQSFASVKASIENNDQHVAQLAEQVAQNDAKIDKQRESLIAVVEKKDDKLEQRLDAINDTVVKVDDKVDSVNKDVATVNKEVSSVDGKVAATKISVSAADSKTENVEAEIEEVKSDVEQIGDELKEASSELDGLITVLAIAFPDEPALKILADKRAAVEMPQGFFSNSEPESAALTATPQNSASTPEKMVLKPTKTIADHCLRAGSGILGCYQRHLDRFDADRAATAPE